MPQPTASPSYILRLDRADEHLRSIQQITQRWRERNPCDLALDCELQTRVWSFRMAVFEPPPDDLQVPISECVHNLRTALDHIGYRLATYVGGDPPPNRENAGFPICRGGRTRFEDSLGDKIGRPKRIPADMRTALDSAQPYQGGDAVNLPILEDLYNCDKHRFPPLLAAIGQILELRVGAVTGVFEDVSREPCEDGTPVLQFTPAPDTEVSMDLQVAFDVAFGAGYPGDSRHVLMFLATTLTYIRQSILPPLAAFL